VQNDRIKKAVRLRERRGRQQQGRIIVDGCREVELAVRAGVPPVELFIAEGELASARIQSLLACCDTRLPEATLVSDEVFRRIAFGQRSEGVVLVARTPHIGLDQLSIPEQAVVCVLEGIEKPGNVGAVLRTADAAGVAAVILADGRTDPYNPNAIRASLGAVFSVPTCAASSTEALQWLRQEQFKLFAARVDGPAHYADVDYGGRAALVLGSEATGLTEHWRSDDITPIALPMSGSVDSLNVSATAAVLFYEALRQHPS
jgi:TrmH family RNA methyltransferase